MQIYYKNNFTADKGESHKLLERAIESMLGEDAKDSAADLVSDIEIGEMGKPSIPGFNDFSISHSENTWAVLFADGYGSRYYCGLDIQYPKNVDVNKLAERWFHAEEAEAVRTKGADEFFRIWARREALVKAVGTSIVNAHLPNTLADEVEFEGGIWQIRDVGIDPFSDPFSPGLNGPIAESNGPFKPGLNGLFAAVCAREITEIKVTEFD